MPIYKAPNNDTFRLDRAAQIDRLPVGCVEITEEELAQITASRRAPDPTSSPAAQIETLERETLLSRPVRDFMLLSMEQAAAQQGATQGLTPAQSIAVLRANNSGYRKVKELDEQIAALRALL